MMNDEDFHRRLDEIREDRAHGASELARRCLRIASESALHAPAGNAGDLRRVLGERAAAMAAARPSMAPLHNLLARWREGLDGLPGEALEALRREASKAALALAEESRGAVLEAAANAAEFIGADKTIITHSLSSTVVEVFNILRNRGARAIVTESRPLCEGGKLAALLSGWSVPTTYVTDAQLGHFVGRADVALVGADALLADGGVVNKAGTYLLALAANDRGVPFYVCCESFKRLPPSPAPALEEMDPAELGVPERPHVEIANVYFDVTPARLVRGWFTEEGGPDQDFAATPPPVS